MSLKSPQSAPTGDEHLSFETAKVRAACRPARPSFHLKHSRSAPAGRMQGAVHTMLLRARPLTRFCGALSAECSAGLSTRAEEGAR